MLLESEKKNIHYNLDVLGRELMEITMEVAIEKAKDTYNIGKAPVTGSIIPEMVNRIQKEKEINC